MLTNLLDRSSLAGLSSDDLTRRLAELRSDERLRLVEFLCYLGEMDRRRSYLDLAHDSLFAYCTDALGYSNGSAFRRITSARLVARFPAAADYLADGRLNLSTLVALKDVLEPENHRELLDRATGQSEEKVKILAASVRPLPEVKESIRRVPTRAPTTESQSLFPAHAVPERTSGPEQKVDTPPVPCAREVHDPPAPAVAPPPRPTLQPIDAERHSLKMTVGPEFMEALKEVRAALSHQVPDGNLEAVLRICMQKTLELCARRKQGARTKRAAEASEKTHANASVQVRRTSGPEVDGTATPRTRTIPAAVRRAVWKRDKGCCAYIGKNGKRCGSKHQLEFDHVKPFALGGEATVDGVVLHCRAHNLHRARAHFGEAHMAQFERAVARTPPERGILEQLREDDAIRS